MPREAPPQKKLMVCHGFVMVYHVFSMVFHGFSWFFIVFALNMSRLKLGINQGVSQGLPQLKRPEKFKDEWEPWTYWYYIILYYIILYYIILYYIIS